MRASNSTRPGAAPLGSTSVPLRAVMTAAESLGYAERYLRPLDRPRPDTILQDEREATIMPRTTYYPEPQISKFLFASRYMAPFRSEEHTSELLSRENLVCRLLLEKKK